MSSWSEKQKRLTAELLITQLCEAQSPEWEAPGFVRLQAQNRKTSCSLWKGPFPEIFLSLKPAGMGLPCGSMAKTLPSQYRGLGFDPWSGN